ncbi:Transcriptional regulator, TraR/DksA family [Nitrospina gracilis 3/211]|uniref:Transcriptional regulator, TraR/DksA family n=1 Tax=Nitrospina gracilis (strain 3/211) TaxID=1266370 RepID=M1YXD0_NITG3|nr:MULTISPECIES: TraR/DksA C4-type zinc finger protein [Nitrospina]MCF8723098.1 DnaK suppressor protein [Nitrospina sp. Nb-3]CCQ90139.1 Transcriptional regulator, TraR/DksA family [Nitrospina gracilis 3/211]
MKPEDLERLRHQLLTLQEELTALDAASKASTKPVELDQARMGRLSRMDAMQDQQMAQEAARRNQQMLVRIEGALRRMDTGRFGDCFVCGEAIDLRRLEFDPTSTRCIDCAEK